MKFTSIKNLMVLSLLAPVLNVETSFAQKINDNFGGGGVKTSGVQIPPYCAVFSSFTTQDAISGSPVSKIAQINPASIDHEWLMVNDPSVASQDHTPNGIGGRVTMSAGQLQNGYKLFLSAPGGTGPLDLDPNSNIVEVPPLQNTSIRPQDGASSKTSFYPNFIGAGSSSSHLIEVINPPILSEILSASIKDIAAQGFLQKSQRSLLILAQMPSGSFNILQKFPGKPSIPMFKAGLIGKYAPLVGIGVVVNYFDNKETIVVLSRDGSLYEVVPVSGELKPMGNPFIAYPQASEQRDLNVTCGSPG